MADIHRTTYTLTVLSEGPLDEHFSMRDDDPFGLLDLNDLITDGHCLGLLEEATEMVLPLEALQGELFRMGNDGTFFECPTPDCCYPLGHEERSGYPCRHFKTGERLS